MPYYAGDFYAGDPGVMSDLYQKAKGALAPLGKELLAGVLGGGGRAMPGLPPGLAGLVKGGPKVPAGALPSLAKAAAAAGADEPKHYRRMNPLNPRALRRSMRRVQSFARFARKTMTFTQRHKLKKGKRR